MIEILAKTRAVIILQYINVSNQHVVHLKLMQCCLSIIFQWKKKATEHWFWVCAIWVQNSWYFLSYMTWMGQCSSMHFTFFLYKNLCKSMYQMQLFCGLHLIVLEFIKCIYKWLSFFNVNSSERPSPDHPI